MLAWTPEQQELRREILRFATSELNDDVIERDRLFLLVGRAGRSAPSSASRGCPSQRSTAAAMSTR